MPNTDPAASLDPKPEEGPPPPMPGMSRGQWIAVLCGVAAFVAMAVVMVVAGNEGSASAPPYGNGLSGGAPPQDPGSRGRTTATEVSPGAEAMSDCGPLDPEHPPEVLFLVEGEEVDLGVVKQGVTVTRDVGFRNIGSGALCVAKVQTGCGCLKATLLGDSKRFDPGESGTIRLVADTTGRVGVIRKSVRMFTNDVKSPQRSFPVKLDVAAGLVSEPRYLQFGSVPPATAATRTLLLRSAKDEADWTVTGVESVRRIAGHDPVKYEFEIETVPDPRYRKIRLRVHHPGYVSVGAVRDVIAITTTHPDRKRIEVPAHIHVVPRIRCRSRTVSLGFVQTGAARIPTRVRIEAGAPSVTFQIQRVEVAVPAGGEAGPAGPGFEADFGKDGRGWWVDVRYDGKSRGEGLLEAELRVHTDDALQPLLTVPIRATVRSQR